MNRVNSDSRVVPQGGHVGQASSQRKVVGPSLSTITMKETQESEEEEHDESGDHAAEFNVDEEADTGNKTTTKCHRKWKVVGKLAVLAQSMNARTIDIYHDRKLTTSRFMIHPNSKLRRAWEVTTVCLVLYVCIMIPLIIGFQFIDWSKLYVMNTFIDIYFIIDMVMTLRTGIVTNGEVVMDPKKVARKYFHSWFLVDLISNFPLVLFVSSSGKSLKIVKLQKIPKLLRIGRLLKYLREYAKYYNLIVSFLGLAIGLHFFACLWASLFNECTDEFNHIVCTDKEMLPMYVQCVYMIMLMFFGIGEGSTYSSIATLQNPVLHATIELYYMSITVFILGTVFSSFLFGNILALLLSWDQQKAQFRNRMDIIKAEMNYYELPEDLQHRVRRNYDYLWINQRAYSEMMLLNQPGISKPLKTTIALHLYKDLLNTVPFFAGSDSRFLGKVCLALKTAVYLPGDTIIYRDDVGKEMFIVRKGLVEILVPDPGNADKRIYLRDGNFFGETALVIEVRRTNTVRAVTICDLNMLSKHAFNEIAAEYPEFGERMKRTVIKRQLDNMNIQSPVEKAKIHDQLTLVVEKSLKQRRMSVSLRSIYRAKKLGDKLKEIADRASNPVRRISRAVVPHRPSTLQASSPRDLQRRRSTEPLGKGESPRVLVPHPVRPLSEFQTSTLPSNDLKRTISRTGLDLFSGPSQHSSSATCIRLGPATDPVSRRMSRSELTLDLIPSALAEITNMVEQIRQTTDRLSRRLGGKDDTDDDLFDDDMAETLGTFPPLTEDSDQEMARRESNSIFVPTESSLTPPSKPSNRLFRGKKDSRPSLPSSFS